MMHPASPCTLIPAEAIPARIKKPESRTGGNGAEMSIWRRALKATPRQVPLAEQRFSSRRNRPETIGRSNQLVRERRLYP